MAVVNSTFIYDFELFDDVSIEDVNKVLNELCKKKYVQQEESYIVGRFSLNVKKRPNEIAKILNKKGWVKYNICSTKNEDRGNMVYFTQKELPFEEMVSTKEDETKKKYLPLDILKIKTWRPWQSKLKSMLTKYDDRAIDIVYDPKGNSGKTTLVKYMAMNNEAGMLYNVNNYKDIMRMAYCVGEKSIYFIDLPRAMKKCQLGEFFSSVETLKDGFCFDDRYTYRQRYMNRPRICIFTNTLPDKRMLSKDMWKIWIIENNDLVKYDKKIHSKKDKLFVSGEKGKISENVMNSSGLSPTVSNNSSNNRTEYVDCSEEKFYMENDEI